MKSSSDQKELVVCENCGSLKHPDYMCKRCRGGDLSATEIIIAGDREIRYLKQRIKFWKDERAYWCAKAKTFEHERNRLHKKLSSLNQNKPTP